MSTITTKDGTEIYYKDWGMGPVVTFSHGWPLNADAWDGQMLFLVQHGYRCVAHDRRGHGRPSQASAHNDMDGYAADLAAVIEGLDLREATLVGHSTGGGEVRSLHWPSWHQAGEEGSPHRSSASDHAPDAIQSRRPADRSVRQDSSGRRRRSLAVL